MTVLAMRAPLPSRCHAVLPLPTHGGVAGVPACYRRSRGRLSRCRAAGGDAAPEEAGAGPSGRPSEDLLASLDLNQLQTALLAAVAAEKYELAAKIRDVLALVASTGGDGTAARNADWRSLGVLDWLAERADSLGFGIPTEVQRRAAPAILCGADCVLRSQTGSGKTLAFLLPALSALGYPPELYPDDLKGPQLLVVVPTRELAVQLVMLVFRLFGGSVNTGVPGASANMFTYAGPRGLKVKGLLLEDEVHAAREGNSLGRAHVVIGTPPLIAAVMRGPGGFAVPSYSRVVVVDEVDACFQNQEADMREILDAACAQEAKPTVVLVGATVGPPLVEAAVAAGWAREPVEVAVGAPMRVPPGLTHRFIRVRDEGQRLVAMARQIRLDLQAQGEDAAPARVMVFAGSEAQAVALAGPLRSVLWGEHRISVLLPRGDEPLQAMQAFRDNAATLLLATPGAARGLDMPAVSHVYNVAPPVDATDYLHRAGRLGRIGSSVPGVVTTMATEEEVPALEAIAAELGIELAEAEEPAALVVEGGELDSVRQGLEDIFNAGGSYGA